MRQNTPFWKYRQSVTCSEKLLQTSTHFNINYIKNMSNYTKGLKKRYKDIRGVYSTLVQEGTCCLEGQPNEKHYDNVIMGAMASEITSLTIVYWTVYSDENQRKHQSYASLAFVWGIHRVPVNSPHKWPVTRKMSAFDDVIMKRI